MAALSFEDYVSHDAMGLAALIHSGKVNAAEVAEAAIGRAEATNPRINAIVERLYDEARAAAKAGLSGPLAGVPWAVKDLGHEIAGVRVTSGSRGFKDYIAEADSVSVKRMRAAGLNLLLTTTSPEFGLTVTTESTLHGQTRNPWNLERTSGGSSGGASAVVAAGIMPATHATDGGGSIRVPAACCGLFGLKPSRGRTPVAVGRTEGWNGLGVSHAVTRSVRDSALLLDVMQGPEIGSRYVAPPPKGTFLQAAGRDPGKPLRIALQLAPASGVAVDPACVAAARDAAKLCEDLGHHVEEAAPTVDAAALGAAMVVTTSTHTAAAFAARGKALGRPMTPDDMEEATGGFVHLGQTYTALDMAAADQAFMTAAIAVATFQETYDLILTPVLAKPPVILGNVALNQPTAVYGANFSAFCPFTALANQTGQPAMSVPLTWSDGLPIGVQFAARLGEEELLFSLAHQLEQARPWFDNRAPL
jgi:Asp-tRNA(Asn)/Glu-tRNA(Gln) amidotransferase A subunit family amidase